MKIITEHPDAVQSPDYQNPVGAKQDNFSNELYLFELERLTGKKDFSYLDLGCAGGQAVVNLYNNGHISCGVEGSDLAKMISFSKHGVADNWIQYKNICLFKGDITKPFEMQDDDNLQKFDVIVAWDVLEHLKESEMPSLIENIKKHMYDETIFITLINTVPFSHHQCIKPEEWWLEIFNKHGMVDIGFTINATPRNVEPPIIRENDIGFIFKLK